LRAEDGPTNFIIVDAEGGEIAKTPDWTREDGDNAYVLAAAPRLLEAGTALVTALDEIGAVSFIDRLDIVAMARLELSWKNALVGMRAAIAAARGENQ